mgnify:CR=1 FL=1
MGKKGKYLKCVHQWDEGESDLTASLLDST